MNLSTNLDFLFTTFLDYQLNFCFRTPSHAARHFNHFPSLFVPFLSPNLISRLSVRGDFSLFRLAFFSSKFLVLDFFSVFVWSPAYHARRKHSPDRLNEWEENCSASISAKSFEKGGVRRAKRKLPITFFSHHTQAKGRMDERKNLSRGSMINSDS